MMTADVSNIYPDSIIILRHSTGMYYIGTVANFTRPTRDSICCSLDNVCRIIGDGSFVKIDMITNLILPSSTWEVYWPVKEQRLAYQDEIRPVHDAITPGLGSIVVVSRNGISYIGAVQSMKSRFSDQALTSVRLGPLARPNEARQYGSSEFEIGESKWSLRWPTTSETTYYYRLFPEVRAKFQVDDLVAFDGQGSIPAVYVGRIIKQDGNTTYVKDCYKFWNGRVDRMGLYNFELLPRKPSPNEIDHYGYCLQHNRHSS